MVVVEGGGGAQVPTVETTVCCAQLDDFDCDVHFRVPDLVESGCATEKCLSVLGHVDEVLPDVPPVVSVRAADVPMSLPTIAEVMSSAVLAGEVASDAAPLAEVETIFVGMASLMEAARAAAVSMSLPAIAEVVSSAVFAGRGC